MPTTFNMICLAVAACLNGIGAHTAPCRSSCSPSFGPFEGPAKRHLRVHEPTRVSEEERVFPAPFSSLESVVKKRSFGEISAEGTSASTPEAKRLKDRFDELLADLELSPHEGITKDQAESTLRSGEHDVNLVSTADANVQTRLQQILESNGDEGWNEILALTNEKTAPIAVTPESLMDQNADPDVVLLAMQGKSASGNLFTQELLETWVEYAEGFERYNPKKPLIYWMKPSEKTLANMLFSYSDVSPRNFPVLKKVLNLLLDSWLDSRLHPEMAFLRLIFDVKSFKAIDFKSLRFSEWMDYVADYNKSLPFNNEVPYVSVLVSLYGTERLLQWLRDTSNSWRTGRIIVDLRNYFKNRSTLKLSNEDEEFLKQKPAHIENAKKGRLSKKV